MPNTIWLAFGLETIQDFEEHYRRLDDFLKREDLDEIVVPEQKRDLLELQQVKDEAFLCNIYYYTPTVLDRHVRDSLTQAVISRNLQKAELSNFVIYPYCIFADEGKADIFSGSVVKMQESLS